MSNRNLLIVAAVLLGAWLLMRGTGRAVEPWNVGQAGSIFQGGHGGGGQ